MAGVGHQFVQQEHHADVGRDMNHVGGKPLVEPSHCLLPAERTIMLRLQNTARPPTQAANANANTTQQANEALRELPSNE